MPRPWKLIGRIAFWALMLTGFGIALAILFSRPIAPVEDESHDSALPR